MRSTLSCDACRKAKVKCTHTGTPPCARCERARIKGCSLTRPRIDLSKANRTRAQRRAARQASSSHQQSSDHLPHSPSERQRDLPPPERHDELQVKTDSDPLVVDRHIGTLPNSVILATLNFFSSKFPELAVLHVPSLMEQFSSSSCSRQSMTLLAAVLAATRAQLPPGETPWAKSLLSREEYAAYTRQRLSEYILQPPSIQVVQALLIMTLHEWGYRAFHEAWVYCGIAIRIMQALHSRRVSRYPLDSSYEDDNNNNDGVAIAIETRTYWACFIVDSMINSGTYNPPMLPMKEMLKLGIPKPLSTTDFAFGRPESVRPDGDSTPLDVTRSFELLVEGFEIWEQVMEFVLNGGRRAPGMCSAQNCPWVPGSPCWLTRSRLTAWREKQHRTLHYPGASVAAHMTLGNGETFTYMNILYYLSVIMLHREYTPFLPTPESVPQGPVDKPLLEATAPEGYWSDNVFKIFESAEGIARILRDASDCGVSLMTPLVGFGAFTAGYVLMYGSWFPRMNFGRSPRAEEYMGVCLEYLDKFRRVWRIADGWIKTIQHSSILYRRAATEGRYRGRTRADFDNLHQSVHEFRVVDRSEQHNQEIMGADQDPVTGTEPSLSTEQMLDPTIIDDALPDTNALRSELMGSNMDGQGSWLQWWPPLDVDMPLDDSTIFL